MLPMPYQIMIIDDTPANLKLLDELLRSNGYSVCAFPRGDMALRAMAQNLPDLILLDINMPGMNGYEVCEKIKADPVTSDVPVIFISALNESWDKVRAFSIGAVDYVQKPFQFEEVLARVKTHLRIQHLQNQLKDNNNHLEERVKSQVKALAEAQLATIVALAKLAESRDDETGHHLERVQFFSRTLADRLLRMGAYNEQMNCNFTENIYYACSLHDIGKVGIPDHILMKPGRLTAQEFEIMKTHTLIGYETLTSVYEKYPNNQLIQMGISIARSHHEHWNGRGYPDGRAGEDIPLSARIMSIVDVYDALRSERCYKPAITHEASVDIITAGSGSQFDPVIVQAFKDVEEEFAKGFHGFGADQ